MNKHIDFSLWIVQVRDLIEELPQKRSWNFDEQTNGDIRPSFSLYK